ncbi:hypothetical protein ACSBOB_23245 [Mesorhizobium sp. ASY16-5R]|uniref:hypothetical protein n=1 Tax=Mesorhizobium sp. ASY16-5R TaxID=3445772 RepID=UPI003F9FE847
MRFFATMAVAGLLVQTIGAHAVELRHITVRTGVDGLHPAPIAVTNSTAAPIVCVAQLAHWYSAVVAQAGPGASTRIALWQDPSTGAFVALNDKQENMPVEALWCGFEGRSYETRAALPLDRGQPAAATPRSVACLEEAGRLACS